MAARIRDGVWEADTETTRYRASSLIVATGYNGEPNIPAWPCQDSFRGEIRHSSTYLNGVPYRGKRVLVVGFGNSGGEIAIDLWENGATPAMAVRSPVNVLPKEVLGIPILTLAIPMSRMPPKLADLLTAPLVKLTVGDVTRLGLRKPPLGPNRQVSKQARIPLLDIGTIGLIEKGYVSVRPGVDRFTEEGVVFTDGREERFDAVVLATGFRPRVDRFLEPAAEVADAGGTPRTSGEPAGLPGLYFCGFYVSPTGMLREIAMEAKKIARHMSRQSEGRPSG